MAAKRAATRSKLALRISASREVAGRYYNTPKELWGFSLPSQRGSARQVATAALRANGERLGIDLRQLDLQVRHVKQTVAGWHVIFGQRHLGTPIHRAYVTVHMNQRKKIYLVKNRAVPAQLLPETVTLRVDKQKVRRIALASVKGSRGRVLASEQVWFPVKDRLRFAHKFRVARATPAHEWLIYVDALNGRILSKYDNLASATGRARVFNPNPVVALGDWLPLLSKRRPVRRVPESAYESIRLEGISSAGQLDSSLLTTRSTKRRLRIQSLDIELQSHEHGFEEVMAYYHVGQGMRYLRSLGYKGGRRIFTKRLTIDARAIQKDDSTYSPGTRRLEFGTGYVDDAEDAEIVLHEFGHAIQDAICPDFGQSAEAAAIGEGFGDYFAGSFFAAKKTGKRRKRFVPTLMTWDGIMFESPNDPTRPPCVRRLDSRRTFETFDHAKDADEHENGEIWSGMLWDIWWALGRKVADRIIIESQFQLDGFTTFARGARAIMDADRNLYNGKHLARLRRIIRRRGIGPIE
jgi:hypothetical protein